MRLRELLPRPPLCAPERGAGQASIFLCYLLIFHLLVIILLSNIAPARVCFSSIGHDPAVPSLEQDDFSS